MKCSIYTLGWFFEFVCNDRWLAISNWSLLNLDVIIYSGILSYIKTWNIIVILRILVQWRKPMANLRLFVWHRLGNPKSCPLLLPNKVPMVPGHLWLVEWFGRSILEFGPGICGFLSPKEQQFLKAKSKILDNKKKSVM